MHTVVRFLFVSVLITLTACNTTPHRTGIQVVFVSELEHREVRQSGSDDEDISFDKQVLENRLAELGLSSTVKRTGKNKLVVDLPVAHIDAKHLEFVTSTVGVEIRESVKNKGVRSCIATLRAT
jgi:hypothetical protein